MRGVTEKEIVQAIAEDASQVYNRVTGEKVTINDFDQ